MGGTGARSGHNALSQGDGRHVSGSDVMAHENRRQVARAGMLDFFRVEADGANGGAGRGRNGAGNRIDAGRDDELPPFDACDIDPRKAGPAPQLD